MAPWAPIWETAAFGDGEKKNGGVGSAPHLGAVESAFGGNKRKIKNLPLALLLGGAYSAPNGFKNLTRAMKIPIMCLVWKLDNGKVVSIANGQNHGQTESHSHPVPY